MILAGCAMVVMAAALWVGNRFGWRDGFETASGKGYAAAVLHLHGIKASEEKAFWTPTMTPRATGTLPTS